MSRIQAFDEKYERINLFEKKKQYENKNLRKFLSSSSMYGIVKNNISLLAEFIFHSPINGDVIEIRSPSGVSRGSSSVNAFSSGEPFQRYMIRSTLTLANPISNVQNDDLIVFTPTNANKIVNNVYPVPNILPKFYGLCSRANENSNWVFSNMRGSLVNSRIEYLIDDTNVTEHIITIQPNNTSFIMNPTPVYHSSQQFGRLFYFKSDT